MNPILRNILAVILGLLGGSIINVELIKVGHTMFPIEGIDPNDIAALAEIMPTLDFNYFIFPFLAHALGTLVGACIAAMIAANRKMTFALVIGCFFLIGGILMNFMLPGPTWFAALDIIVAYIPMAFIGGKIGEKLFSKKNS